MTLRAIAAATVLALPAASRAEMGTVVQATPARAYLDRGGEDGLAPGMRIDLLRRGKPVGSCELEYLAPNHATCRFEGARPGDTFALPSPAPDTTTAGPSGPRPVPLSGAERTRREEALAAAPQLLHAYRGPKDSGLGRRFKAEAELAHASWMTNQSSAFSRESVSVAIRGAELVPGLRLYLDATAWHWTARPADARFRPDTDTQLFVRRAEVAVREPGTPFALAAGRIWPWHAPAVTLFDGVQAGWRSVGGGAEAGLFGGGVPDALTTAPSFDTWLAGAYWAVTRASHDGPFSWLRHEGQISVVQLADADTRFEAAGRLRGTVVQGLDGGLELRGTLGGDADARVTGFIADLGARHADRIRLSADFRWLDAEALAIEAAGTPLLLATSRRANAIAAWDAARWLSVAGIAGFTRDVSDDRTRQWFGPELSLPRVFGGRGGLDVGYQEEAGWLEGRTAWVGANLLPLDRLRLLGRLSYLETASGQLEDPDVLREGGLWLSAQARLLAWLVFDASVLTRLAIETTANSDPPGGWFANLRLRGQL